MQRVYFVYEKDKKDPLFQRSLLEIRYLNGEIPRASEEFFPLLEEEEFEEKLFQNDPNQYYLYLMMKIHHFVAIMHDVRITKMSGDFVNDNNSGTRWLMNISRVQYENLPKKVEPQKEETQYAKIQSQFQDFENLVIPEPNSASLNNPKKAEIVKALNVEIREQYEKLKYHTGMELKNGELDESATLENFVKLYESGAYKFYSPQNRGRQPIMLPIKLEHVQVPLIQKMPKSESFRSSVDSQTKKHLAPRNINNFKPQDVKFLKQTYSATGVKPGSKLIFTKQRDSSSSQDFRNDSNNVSKASTERGLDRSSQKRSSPLLVISTSRGRSSTFSADRISHIQM